MSVFVVGVAALCGPSASHAHVSPRVAVSMKLELGTGMRTRSLGSSGILVSELALGTQRWGSTDFNAPNEKMCHAMLDLATSSGVNLVDTAEQYPIPSGPGCPEGATEKIIGSWMAADKSRREQLVIASKITGGTNVTPKNIEADLKGTLERLGTDYLDASVVEFKLTT
jgi:aryl-alcohol dehydrogenase-like predicted oxidoreductase